MQHSAANAESGTRREVAGGGHAFREETDPSERIRFFGRKDDAELFGGEEAVWHQAFAAGFIDWTVRTLCECDGEAFAARGDGGGEARWSASAHEYIGLKHLGS